MTMAQTREMHVPLLSSEQEIELLPGVALQDPRGEPSSRTMTGEDDMNKAIDLAMEGKMNPERFKKAMPQSAARLCGNFDRSVSEALFDQIFALTQSKMMKNPNLMKEHLRCQHPGQKEKRLEATTILLESCIAVGTDNVVFNQGPYQNHFLQALEQNVHRKSDNFPIDSQADSNVVFRDIYFAVYLVTSYEYQEEIESSSGKNLDEVCLLVHDEQSFCRALKSYLQDMLKTLPTGIATFEEFLQEITQHFRAKAVVFSCVRSVRVIKEMPDDDDCLRCWVCKSDSAQNCSDCKSAAFCGRKCQGKAWKRNHKVLCPHYKRILKHAKTQCDKIADVQRQNFIADSHLQPNQYFDYMMVISSCSMEVQRMGRPLDGSMENFYRNVVQVENDDTAFQTLFEPAAAGNDGWGDHNLDVIKTCVRLMYNGSQELPIDLPGRKITRNTFLNCYKNVNEYVKQSEEMVIASVTEDLQGLFQSEDMREFTRDQIDSMRDALMRL